jgi:hypothetical protein
MLGRLRLLATAFLRRLVLRGARQSLADSVFPGGAWEQGNLEP